MWGIDAADFTTLGLTVATLVVLEGLLSADNALVLAVMVRHLPTKLEQKRALRYGMIGAFVFRFIAVLFASKLLRFWILKAAGGIYLLYLALSHLLHAEGGGTSERKSRFGSGFWATVIGVEITDVIFSVDSILAAVGTAGVLRPELGDKPLLAIPSIGLAIDIRMLVIYLGGVLGIIAMRFVAGYFLLLLERFHGLAVGAYYLVGWIGIKLLSGGLHDALHPNRKYVAEDPAWHASMPTWVFKLPLEMDHYVFWAGMALIVIISMLVKNKPGKIDLPPDPAEPGDPVD